MGATTQVHIVAAVLALACGSVALYAVKGRTLHRRSGLSFAIEEDQLATSTSSHTDEQVDWVLAQD